MSDRTIGRAVARHKERVSLVLSCVIAYPVPITERNTESTSTLRLPQRQYWLHGDVVILFSCLEELRAVNDAGRNEPWRIGRAAYFYQLRTPQSRDFLAFHWHPETSGPVQFLHLHASSDTAPLSHKTHVPTGFVSLGAVVRLLIAEFGVPPLRDDWQTLVSDEGYA